MRLPRLVTVGLFACFLLISTSVSANKCTTGCHGTQPGKAYQEGHTYTYQLEGTSITSVSEAQGEATLKLSALVEVSVNPNCIRQLNLKNVQINGAPVSLQDIEQHALQFNYHDGHIDTEVCAESGDSQSSLNIKRAVVSLFQTAVIQESGATTHHEIDVFGGCPTDFSFHKEGDSLVVRKFRDLGQCSFRENIKQDLISTTFNLNSNLKASPLLASSQKVEQHLKRGVLVKAKSTETYNFRPFSNGEAGAKTIVETVLTLKGQTPDAKSAAPVSEAKSLIFEAPHPVVKSSVDAIVNALRAVAQEETTDSVKPFAARRFVELIKVLRVSSKNDILTVYHRVKAGAGFDKKTDKKTLLDALFRTGSGESSEVAVELIKSHEIVGVEALLFYTSLSLVRHVNLPSVTSIATLLDQPSLPRSAYLGIGSLIGKYCEDHDCRHVGEVNDALGKILSKIGNGKTDSREQEDIVVAALKGLGNTKYLDDSAAQRLARIAADKTVHNRVRVAAIEALPTTCSMTWKNAVFPILADREEDSEVRIKTYLSLVSCPCPHVANTLKSVLDKETVNQVGSFITSHLRNLRASADPNKQEAKKQLGLVKPRTKFPEDFRKFSFNNELSYSIDTFGVGTSAESNVIYSQNSFIPRSASLNLTTEIFGHTFNFLELNTRVENLDRLVERYFGPKGFFNEHELKDVIIDGKKTIADVTRHIKERFQKSTRGRRDVGQAEIDAFGKAVRLRDNEVDQDVDLDLSLKLFGTELIFLSYEGATQKLTPDLIVDKIFDTLDAGLKRAKNFDYNLENHLHFLDAELVYPTGLGLPLSLGVTGTSVVHLKTSGKIDIPAIIRDPRNAGVQVALEPSASVRIAGSLIVEGLGVESGFKIISTLHTSTGSDVSVKLLDGKGIDVSFGIPKKKQELFSVSSEVLLSSGSKGDNYVAPKFSKGKEVSDCFEQLSGLLGLTVCGHVSFPYDTLESIQKKPLFPLSGPAKFSVTVENNDVTSYHFKVHYNDKNPKARSLEVLLETPNTKTNRRLAFLIEGALEPEKFLKVSIDSPFKKASVEAIAKANAEEHTITVTVHNDKIEYFVRAGVQASGNKYKPILEYKVPEHIEKLAGIKSGTKTSVRNKQQYNVQGVVEVTDANGGKRYVFDKVVLSSSGRKLIGLDGSVLAASSGAGADLKIGYGEETVAFKVDVQKLGDLHYTLQVSALPSKNPDIGFDVKWEGRKDKSQVKNNLVFVHGRDLNDQKNRLTIDQDAIFKYESLENVEFSTKNKLTYPALGLVFKAEAGATGKSVEYDVEFKYDKFKLESELSAKTGIAKPGDYEIEFEAKILENSVEVKSKRTIVGEHKSKFENCLELSPGGKYELIAVVVHDLKPGNVNAQVDADLSLNGKKVKLGTSLEVNPQKLNSHAVVDVDGVKYVNFVLKVQRSSSHPSGNLDLNLKNYLIAVGQFSYQNGKGKADINIDVPKISRKIKGTGDLSITGTQHVANLEILYDAEKDPGKRIKLSTNSDITKTSIDTRNVIEILTNKFEINAKGKLQGSLENGHLNGEFDVTLPNGRYLVFKGERAFTRKDDTFDARLLLELVDHVNKGGQSRKIVYNVVGDDVNRKDLTFQAKHDLKFVNFDGRDIQLGVALKNLPTGPEKKLGEIQVTLTGAIVPKPLNFDFSSNYGADTATWKLVSSIGNDFAVKGGGTGSRGNNVDKPSTVNAVIELKLPSDKVRNIKMEISDSLLTPKEPGGLFEYINSKTITYNDDKTIKVDGHVKHVGIDDCDKSSEGSAKLTVTVLKNPPLTIGSTYKHDPTGEVKKGSGSFNVNYGEKEATVVIDTNYLPDLTSLDLNVKATTPIEKFRHVDLQLGHKREGDGQLRKTDVTVTADNAKYTLKSQIQTNQVSPSIDFVATYPNGKIEVLAKFNKLGEKEYAGEWKLDSPHGFVAVDGHVNLESFDNFVVNVNFDSDKVKQRKIHAVIANKPTAKAGRRIVVTVTSEGKNIVTGSTNYKKREEEGKTIVEGNGSLKIGENTKSSSFKYTHQRLTQDIDSETGAAILLNANFGLSAIVGELKLTNKEIHVFNSYCEQSKDCAHFKLQSKLASAQLNNLDHQITVEVDLKKFNVPVEFGLKTSTKSQALTLDHTASLYLHSSKDKTQYTYQLYVHPKESALILTLPSRELALVTSFDLPKTKRTGSYKIDVSVYLDRKNKPSEKTSLTLSGEVSLDKNTAAVTGETRFTYPLQPKEMTMKGKLYYGGDHLLDAYLDIDVFAKKAQKITVAAKLINVRIPKGFNVTSLVEVTSRGQQLKADLQQHLALSPTEVGFGSIFSYTDEHQKPKNTGILFSANFRQVHLLVKSPDKELIKSDTTLEISENLQKVDTEVAVFGNAPAIVNIEARDFNSFKYLSYIKDKPNSKVVVNGRVVRGELAEVHADLYKEGEKKNLFNALIHFDESKFLKPEYSYSKDNIVSLIDYHRKYVTELAKQLKTLVEQVGEEIVTESKDLLEHLKKAQPNLKPLLEYYQTELDKLKTEIHADETVKEIVAILNKVFGGVFTAVTETLKKVTVQVQDLQKQLNEIAIKVTEAIKATYPHIKESYTKILHAAINVFEAIANLAEVYLKALLNIINEHQKEIKEALTVVSELAQDIVKIIFKGYDRIEKDLKDFVKMLVEQLKALPIFDLIQDKYKELVKFQIPESALSSLNEIVNSVKAVLPTEELKELITVVHSYVVKRVKGEKVDDVNEIKNIYSHTIDALQSVVTLLQSRVTTVSFFNFFETPVFTNFVILKTLPGVVNFKFSILSLLFNRELPSPLDAYYTYRPTLRPLDVIPPFSKTGLIVDGGHFFTFDGRHFTLPGSCNYVLAQDIRDGNFSVVANLNKGSLTSITITEPNERITINADGRILVNGKPSDFPVSTKNLHAFLTSPGINVKSDYGVLVKCRDKAPLICKVHVSGFYLGKLRGLFGDGNNEPWDDLTLPSGKITENEAEFGDAYKLNPTCPSAPVVDHHSTQRSPVCTEYFSGNSPLSACFNYVNPSPYRQACDHATNAGTSQGACLISVAYHTACREARVPVNIPSACGTCQVGSNEIAIGDTFSVKVPRREADVVFVVEQTSENERVFKELITPLITDIKNELKLHGISDIHVGLIGYSEKLKWPQHYTTGGDRNIGQEVKNIVFQKVDPIISLKEAKEGDVEKKLTYLRQRINVELGTFKLTDAYEEAIRYPFRPGAAKVVIGVISSPCEKSPLPISLQQVRLLLGQKIYRDLGLTYFHVSTLDDILVSGKSQKNIVGFDYDSAYTFADSKKRPIEGNAELRNDMVLSSNDVCAGFAVSSGGAAFSTHNFLEGKANQKKQFLQVTARRVAISLTNVELEEDCVCQQVDGLQTRSACTIVGRKEKEPISRHTKGGVKG